MIPIVSPPILVDLARQHHQELLAAADHYRRLHQVRRGPRRPPKHESTGR